MLVFVGLGLHDENDITLKGLKALKEADIVYAELYTSSPDTSVEKMEKTFGIEIRLLTRKEIEEEAEETILKDALTKNVAILCGGDPMVATTHVDLRLRAIDMGIETRVIHASSIYSAAPGICGLHIYKFGRSATVTPPYRGIIAEDPYDAIISNRRQGLHTLLFLDIDMTIRNALDILERIEENKLRRGETSKKEVKESIMVGISNAGSENPRVRAGFPDELKKFDFGQPPHVLIAVGELHFMEEEALIKIASLDERCLRKQK